MIEPSSPSAPPPFVPPVRRRAPKGLIFGILIGLLGLLAFLIPRLADVGSDTPGPTPTAPSPPLDTAAFAQRWPDILARAAAPPRGQAAAPFTMVEFGDFQCPHCGKVVPVIEKIIAQNPGRLNLFFVHMTWPQHQFAIPAAQAAQAAAAQGKFWPMYDLLYRNQDDLEPGFYTEYAAKIGLDKTAFKQMANAAATRQKVTDSTEFANALGIQSTPTILLRDNARGTVTAYVGMGEKGMSLPDGTKKDTLGLKDLIANPPWAAKSKH